MTTSLGEEALDDEVESASPNDVWLDATFDPIAVDEVDCRFADVSGATLRTMGSIRDCPRCH